MAVSKLGISVRRGKEMLVNCQVDVQIQRDPIF